MSGSLFTLEPSRWGDSYLVGIGSWSSAGYPDPITGASLQQITMTPGDGKVYTVRVVETVTDPAQTVALAPRIGPDKQIHFWYGKPPSGANIKVFPPATTP